MDRKWITLSNTTLGTFIGFLDTSIVLVSLPTIGRELPGASPEVLLWVVLSYNLVTTVLLLTLGRLSDMFGRVRLYTIGFGVFTAGSALASAALSGPELLAARVIQGTGAGFLFANSAAILTDAFPANERGRAIGINQVAGILGSILGLVIGGILTTELGWRSIFWVNIPIGIFGTVWAHYQLVELHPIESTARIDWAGNATFGLAISTGLLGITLGGLLGWASLEIVLLLVASVVFLALFVVLERRIADPMFDLALLKIRTFLFGNVAASLSTVARGAFTFVMVFYFQGVVGTSAERAGILLLPLSVAFGITGPLAGALSDRTGARYLGTVGLLVNAVGFALLVDFPPNGPYGLLAIAMVLLGIGQGMFGAPNRAEVMSSVPSRRRGVAAATGVTFLNSGTLASLALGFTVLSAYLPRSALANVFEGSPSGAPVEASAFVAALHALFPFAMAISLVAAALNLQRGSPYDESSTSEETERTRNANR